MTVREIEGRLHDARADIARLKRRCGADEAAWDEATRERFDKLKRICRAMQNQRGTRGPE